MTESKLDDVSNKLPPGPKEKKKKIKITIDMRFCENAFFKSTVQFISIQY